MGCKHDILADVAVLPDQHGGWGHEPPLALNNMDAARFEQPLQALVFAANNPLAVCGHTRNVNTLKVGTDPERCGFPGGVCYLGSVKQRLGGNASSVQTGAADPVFFDECDRSTQLNGT